MDNQTITKQTPIAHILSFLNCPYSHIVTKITYLCISWMDPFKNCGCSKNQYLLFTNMLLNTTHQSSILICNADTALVHKFHCWNRQWSQQVSLKHYTSLRLHTVTHPSRQQSSVTE